MELKLQLIHNNISLSSDGVKIIKLIFKKVGKAVRYRAGVAQRVPAS